MAKLKVLKANQGHFDEMIEIDHGFTSNFAYRLITDLNDQDSTFKFERVKLPREAHLSYMRDKDSLLKSWNDASLIYVGELDGVLVGYIAIDAKTLPATARISDLVVMPELRQKNIGRTMLAVAESWALENNRQRVLIETPMRNYPMVEMVLTCGYELCGFLDQYFPNSDPALFFQKRLA
ncbi:MAG: GNAT family N-acetyltransferase [Anaerolineaceae bacterium]|jgi:ribosomal protein S18 acetylase RimI-like enzyme